MTVGAALPHEIRLRLDRIAADNPSWGPSLGLYELAVREAADPAWDLAVDVAPGATGGPLLSGARVLLDQGGLTDWGQRLARAASGAADGALEACASRLPPLEIAAAAIRLDFPALERLAERAGVLCESVMAFAALAATPVLATLGRRLAQRLPAGWRAGYCPLCGAWPTLAELRGVEGGRFLRCGRCGTGWEVEWLRCPYCDTVDHAQLGSLEPETEGDRRRVDTCAACHGYLKAIPTLLALGPQAVVLEDLGSVDLDIVALERGYARPGPPPVAPLDVDVADLAACRPCSS